MVEKVKIVPQRLDFKEFKLNWFICIMRIATLTQNFTYEERCGGISAHFHYLISVQLKEMILV